MSMSEIIFVNATACTSGGVLTILNQFIENIKIYDRENVYYIFSTKNIDVNLDNVNIITNIKGKKYLDRIKWDLFGVKRWAKEKNIRPKLIISLQNTGVRFNNVKQMIYLHQPLPFATEFNWNFFDSDERLLWLYKNIYRFWIRLTVKKDYNIIVQTEWMKEALVKKNYNEKKILIAKPDINNIQVENIRTKESGSKILFYPAANYKYKNHMIIIKAVRNILDKNNLNEYNFKVVFTLSKESNIYKYVLKNGLEKYFEFIDSVSYETVLSYYKSCQVVLFPSYIETFGLPLIEGSKFGKKILVSNCSYSREILSEYSLAKFLDYDDESEWSKAIIDSLKDYEDKPCSLVNGSEWGNIFDTIEDILKL